MNYNEAQDYLNSFTGSLFLSDNTQLTIVIGPSDLEDFQIFLKQYNPQTYRHDVAKLHCSDGKYKVYGIYQKGDAWVYKRISDNSPLEKLQVSKK